MHTVLVTGGTGFVGTYVVRALVKTGHHVRLLTRSPVAANAVECVQGDVLDENSLREAVKSCSAVVHLVGIIREDTGRGITFDRIHREGTRRVVEVATAAGVGTFVHMSANGASESGTTAYQRSKWQAEEIVRNAPFDRWTIFRPSLVFGAPPEGREEFCSQLIDTLLRPFPVWPVFGNGLYRFQPIAVQNVADAFALALEDERFSGKTYSLGGPDTLTYREILHMLARSAGLRPRPVLSQPLWLVRPLVSALEPTGLLPITRAQLEMLVEGNTCDDPGFTRDFDLELIRFDEESLAYLRSG